MENLPKKLRQFQNIDSNERNRKANLRPANKNVALRLCGGAWNWDFGKHMRLDGNFCDRFLPRYFVRWYKDVLTTSAVARYPPSFGCVVCQQITLVGPFLCWFGCAVMPSLKSQKENSESLDAQLSQCVGGDCNEVRRLDWIIRKVSTSVVFALAFGQIDPSNWFWRQVNR